MEWGAKEQNGIVILLGSYHLECDQRRIEDSYYRGDICVANEQYERKLLKGFSLVHPVGLLFVSCPRVGDWPFTSKRICVKGFSEDEYVKTVRYKAIYGLRNQSKTKGLIRFLRKALKSLPADCPVHVIACEAHRPYLSAVRYLKSKRRGVFSTLIVPDLPEDMSKKDRNPLYRYMKKRDEKAIYALCDRYVDSFLAFTADINSKINPSGKPSLIYEGIVEPRVFAKQGEPKKERVVCGFFGRLDERNGVKLLLEASALLPKNYVIYLYGSGEMENVDFSLYPNVRYFGFLDPSKVATEIEKCDILLSPRLSEGNYTRYSFPSKVFEYLSFRKPIVTFRLPCYFKELDDVLVYPDAETPAALAKAVESVGSHHVSIDQSIYDVIMTKYNAAHIATSILRLNIPE